MVKKLKTEESDDGEMDTIIDDLAEEDELEI